MESILNILLIATLAIIGFAIFMAWRVIRTNKGKETIDAKDAARMDRWLNVIHILVYVLVVIIVLRFYLSSLLA